MNSLALLYSRLADLLKGHREGFRVFYFIGSGMLMFLRHEISAYIGGENTPEYWECIYNINMICYAIALHGLKTKWWLANFVLSCLIWFIWFDLIDRNAFGVWWFTKDDLLTIATICLILVIKLIKKLKKK